VTITTGDGVSCPLDLYRPSGPPSVDVILLGDLPGGRAEVSVLAEALAAHGCRVGCVELRPLRGAGGAAPVWGRTEDPLTPWTEAWREVEAARDRLRAEAGSGEGAPVWVLAGIGTGASAAAVAASRLPHPPDALVLVEPKAQLAGIPIAPILAGLEIPVLLFCPLDASEAREVATDAYLACRPRSTLWMSDGVLARPARLFELRSQLAVDLAHWIVGQSAGSGSTEDPARRGDVSGERAR
jgi:pimeloyl-ACP methyl ester carboxylesterase